MSTRLLQLDTTAPGPALEPGSPSAQRWEALLGAARRDPDPRSYLVIEDEGRIAGWMRMDRLTADWYSLVELMLVPGPSAERVGRAALGLLPSCFAGMRLEAATWARHTDEAIQALVSGELPGGHFELYVEKLYVRRPLVDWKSPYPDPFALVSLVDAGEEAVIEALGQAMTGSPARDLHPEDPRAEFHEMRLLEGETHDPERWSIALLDGEPAGVILANRFPYDDEGTFTFIGLSQRLRGRHLGAVLHARGLDVLRDMGVRRYLCSTDVRNRPMLRTYARHGCQPFDVRRQYLWRPD